MTSASLSPTQAGRSETRSLETQGRRFAARRLVFSALFLILLVAIGIGANYGPLRHYLEARGRLDERVAQVAALEERNAELQAQLGKLSQSGYLEDMARQQLTYALPGEDLYIVSGLSAEGTTGPAGFEGMAASDETAASGPAAPDSSEASDASSATDPAASLDSTAAMEEGASARPGPGFLERLLIAVRDLF